MVWNGDTGSAAWRPKSQQNAKALRSFRDAMEDIRTVLEFRPDAAMSVDFIRNAGRKVSVELRKLLLDGTPLVHRVLERPRFRPLRDRGGLTGDVNEINGPVGHTENGTVVVIVQRAVNTNSPSFPYVPGLHHRAKFFGPLGAYATPNPAIRVLDLQL